MPHLARQDWPEDEVTSPIATLGALLSTHVSAVTGDTPLAQVRALLAERRIAAVAVIGGDGSLDGLLTRTDVLRAPCDAVAADAMSSFVLALPATAPIERGAALMAYEGVGVIAVIDADDGLLGLVSAADIVRHYATEAGYLT
jgi:CBS domain-containing protein